MDLDTAMITTLLSRRTSVRAFADTPIPAAVVLDILEAGRLSPSGGNEQAWAFGVVNDPEIIARIADAAHAQHWIAAAPLLIVLCTVPVSDELGGRDIQVERFPELAGPIRTMDPGLYTRLNQEEHQTKIAGTHMALAALEHGIGSCWVSRFVVGQVAEILHLPAGMLPSEILVLGYPLEEHAPRKKKPLAELVFYNQYSHQGNG
jgi:nitroreductase